MSQRSSLLAALWVTAVLLAAPDNDCWFDWGTAVTTDRTSLIVDPPDGSIPPLTPAAPRLRAARAEARSEVGTDEPPPGGWTSGASVRCVVGFNAGPLMTPSAYNTNVHLFQTPDYWVVPLVLAAGLATAAGQDLRLVSAAAEQDTQAVRALLDAGVDADTPRADGATALLWAAHWDDLDMVDLLLRAGADVTAADDHRVTPLQRAAENVSTAMVEKLLAAGASANAVQTSGLAPLMTAARTGNVQVVNALLAHGADVNAATTETKSTALMWAVAGPHPDIVRALLDAGADPHTSTLKGLPPLLFAARNGDIQMAETLIAAGVDVNATGVDGTHALPYAIVSGHDAFALFLLEQVADPKRFDGWSGRTARCRWSRLHLVGRLEPKARRERPVLQVRQDRCRPGPQAPVGAVAPRARRGPECAHHDVRHGHELYRSAQERRVRAVRVRHGRSARATPLWVAAFEMNGAGDQVFGVGSSGTSSSAEILRTLLAAGADQHLTTDDGNTPFMAAAGLGRSTYTPREPRGVRSPSAEAAVKLLLEAGADIDAVNEADFTALHGASFRGLNEVIEYLVEQGADIDVPDFRGRTAYRMAEGSKQSFQFQIWPETAELLKQLGANTRLGIPGTVQERLRDVPVSANQQP